MSPQAVACVQGVHPTTVQRWVGRASQQAIAADQKVITHVVSENVQLDELHSFAGAEHADGSEDDLQEVGPHCLGDPAGGVRRGGVDSPTAISTSLLKRMDGMTRQHVVPLHRKTRSIAKYRRALETQTQLFKNYYNLCRKHGTLKGKTPAQAASLTGRTWTSRELLTYNAAVTSKIS